MTISDGLHPWLELARATVVDRPLILVGIGIDQLRAFQQLGGRVQGAICVLPAGGPEFVPDDPFPVLVLRSETRNVFDLVVAEFAPTLEQHARRVLDHLATVDPEREATVVAYLPFPPALLDGRTGWTQDSGVARALEHKSAGDALMADVLPAVPSIACDWPLSRSCWEAACGRFATTRLVLQKLDLNGGGRGTRMCSSYAQAQRAFGTLEVDAVRLMPFLDGQPCNVMGCVVGPGHTLVLPPSRQLIDEAGDRPVYAGNAFDDGWSDAEIDGIGREVLAFGHRLATRGFVGPFGLDFVRLANGSRRYHDINARMNGAVDNLALALAEDGVEPLRVLLLAHRQWSRAESDGLERLLRERTRRQPVTRFFLSCKIAEPHQVAEAPAAGLWRLGVAAGGSAGQRLASRSSANPAEPGNAVEATYGGPSASLAGLSDDVALLRPLVPPGSRFQPGDRLILGDLYCTAATATHLQQAFGRELSARLIDAILA